MANQVGCPSALRYLPCGLLTFGQLRTTKAKQLSGSQRAAPFLGRRSTQRSYERSAALLPNDFYELTGIASDANAATAFASQHFADIADAVSAAEAAASFTGAARATQLAEPSVIVEITSPQRMEGILSPISDTLEAFVLATQRSFADAGVPYPLGSSIIFSTFIVKVLTYPFTKVQVESALNMQNLQPQVDAVREKYKKDQERMNIEINRLYEENQVSPLAGCGPLLLTLPVVWGLYRAFNNASIDGSFDEPWFFIPSLAGPSPDRNLDWLLPLDANYQPPSGWHDASLYLVVPILTVASQYVSMNILSPAKNGTDPNVSDKESQSVLLNLLPLFVGYISLTVPAGLALYWLFNNIFTTATQVYLRQGGGAVSKVERVQEVQVKVPLCCALVDMATAEKHTFQESFSGPYVICTQGSMNSLSKEESITHVYREQREFDDAKWAKFLDNRCKRTRRLEERDIATPDELRSVIAALKDLGQEEKAKEIADELARLESLGGVAYIKRLKAGETTNSIASDSE